MQNRSQPSTPAGCAWSAPALVLLALVLASAARAAEDAPLQIVASVYPLELIVREIGGERVSVRTLVPPGASPHAFEPRPGDMARLARARYFVRVGGGFDDWAEKLAAAAPASLEIVVVADLDARRDPEAGPGAHARHSGPHVWLDPLFVRDVLVPAVEHRLSEADPPGEIHYRARARAFADRLGALDREIRSILGSASGRRYVAFHNAWRHFANRYGLEEVAVVHEFAGEEPTPRELGRLIRAARDARLKAILVEPQLSSGTAAVIAAECGAGTVTVDPLGDPEDPDRDSYGELLRFNARAFAVALGSHDP